MSVLRGIAANCIDRHKERSLRSRLRHRRDEGRRLRRGLRKAASRSRASRGPMCGTPRTALASNRAIRDPLKSPAKQHIRAARGFHFERDVSFCNVYISLGGVDRSTARSVSVDSRPNRHMR